MIVFNTALSFVLLFTVHGVPTLFETESRFDLPGSDLSLKLSAILSGKRHLQSIKYPLYMMQLYHNLLMKNESKLSERVNTSDYDIVLSLVAKSKYISSNGYFIF